MVSEGTSCVMYTGLHGGDDCLMCDVYCVIYTDLHGGDDGRVGVRHVARLTRVRAHVEEAGGCGAAYLYMHRGGGGVRSRVMWCGIPVHAQGWGWGSNWGWGWGQGIKDAWSLCGCTPGSSVAPSGPMPSHAAVCAPANDKCPHHIVKMQFNTPP